MSEKLNLDKKLYLKKVKLMKKMKETEENLTSLNNSLSMIRRVLENIKTKGGNLVNLETKHRWLKTLLETANGQLFGKEKIMLETYVQMNFFVRFVASLISVLW